MRRIAIALLVMSVVLIPVTAIAAPLQNDGFESGNLSGWSAGGGVTAQQANVHSGQWAATGTNGNTWVRKDFTATSTVYSEAWFYRDSNSTNVRLFRYQSTGSGNVARIFVQPSGVIMLRNDFTGVTLGSVVQLPLDTWHRVEFQASVVAGTSDSVGVWLDGSPVGNLTSTQNLGDLQPVSVTVLNDTTGTYDFDLDDACVDVVRINGSCGSALPQPPTVTSFAPSSGVVGTSVTLTGTNFTGATSTTFNGTSASFSVTDAQHIATTVPAGATDGAIAVTTPNGTGTSAASFDVTVAGGESLTVAFAADICGNTTAARTRCRDTGDLVQSLGVDAVIVGGDLAYENGTTADFNFTPNGYGQSWGSANSPGFYDITYPAVGNHEYNDPATGPGAEGYRAHYAARGFFGTSASPLYYSTNLGDWHLVVLDSNDPVASQCADAQGQPGIRAGCPQLTSFLTPDLNADTHLCELAVGHHSRYSSGTGSGHGSVAYLDAAWDLMVNQGVDIYLSGHDHLYERFAQVGTSDNVTTSGIRQFVVGTGGGALETTVGPCNGCTNAIQAGPLYNTVGSDDPYGVLVLTLEATNYSWQFIDQSDGSIDDSGAQACH